STVVGAGACLKKCCRVSQGEYFAHTGDSDPLVATSGAHGKGCPASPALERVLGHLCHQALSAECLTKTQRGVTPGTAARPSALPAWQWGRPPASSHPHRRSGAARHGPCWCMTAPGGAQQPGVWVSDSA